MVFRKIFEHVTLLFSQAEVQAEVPLVHEFIPILEAIEHDLTKVRDSRELPHVIRIAAIAGFLVVSNNMPSQMTTTFTAWLLLCPGCPLVLCNSTDMTLSAMCPDKKLDRFNFNEDWRAEDRLEVDHIVWVCWRPTRGWPYCMRAMDRILSAAQCQCQQFSELPEPG